MTPLKVYVAGGSIDKAIVSMFMASLRAGGCEVTLDWPALQDGEKTPDHMLSEDERLKYSGLDLEGVRKADLLWYLIPSVKGRSIGGWLEFGYALGLGKLVLVSGTLTDSIFTSQAHAGYWGHGDALQAILEKNKLRLGGRASYGNGTEVEVTRAQEKRR